jgi:filamentous hemagglutinin family protein
MISDRVAIDRTTNRCRHAVELVKCLALSALLGLSAGPGAAQVVLDGKFGTSGPLTGPNYTIGAGLGAIRGNNLFHSFSQFDLKAGDVAQFTGPANIQNVLSRVTGGKPSSIDGTIRSEIPGANFYFINPSGIVFGPHAYVDVSGALAVSSADYLKLADGTKFMATLDADDSKLTSAPVSAFGFLPGASGSVEVHGSLHSAPGSPLSVIGTTVLVGDGAKIEALDSQMTLAGVSAPGEYTPVIQPSIKGGLAASGDTVPAGTVVIRGGRLVVENAHVDVSQTGGDLQVSLSDSLEVHNGGQLTTESSGSIHGGNVVIDAPNVVVDSQEGPLPTRVAAETSSPDPLGAGGNVIIHSTSLEIDRGAEVSVSTFGAADAGTVDITTGSMRMSGSVTAPVPTQISANAAPISGIAFGAGGKISIHADTMELDNFAIISASTLGDANAGSIDITARSLSVQDCSITTYTSTAGNGGDIRIQTQDLTLDGMFGSITALTLGVNSTSPAGRGGNVNVKTGSLKMLNDAAIAAGTYGDGAAGTVSVTADSILLDTGHPQPGIYPGISSSSSPSFDGTPTAGKGGDVVVNAGSLELRNGMTISVATSTPGSGGNISIDAKSVAIEGAASIQSNSDGTGHAGTVTLHSSGDVLLSGGGSISTAAPQSSGGDIEVRAGRDIRLIDSQITAQAGPGGGGNITTSAPELIYLLNGSLNAQAVGDGGNLAIDSVFFIMNNGALVSKSASANGGNISIMSDFFFQSESLIDASAPFGLPGTVTVSAPEVDLSGVLIGLPSNLLNLETELRPDCGVRLSGNISSFIVLGQGGLPLSPEGFLPSQAAPTRNGDK